MSSEIQKEASSARTSAAGFFRKTLPKALKSAVTWPARLSMPAKAAWCVFLFLAVVSAAVWLVLSRDPRHVSLYHVLTVGRAVLVAALVVVIPVVVYFGLKLWLEGDMSQYPEIDYAWDAGLKALAQHGLSLDAAPVFLVLGAAGEDQEKAIADSSGRGFRVRGTPEGSAALHWYANPDGVYLCCSDVGMLSALAGRVRELELQESESVRLRRAAVAAPTPSRGAAGGQTMSLEQFVGADGGYDEDFAGGGRTMSFDEPAVRRSRSSLPRFSVSSARFLSASLAEQEQAVRLPANEAAEQTRRLAYLGQLLARAREPLCGVNGILAILPFHTMEAGPTEAEELEKAVKSDLGTLMASMQLRCPVTALVVGLEEERGFSELVRRVGRERAATQRFGRSFNLRSRATTDELSGFSAHVCGAFEDWVYTLFREHGALTRPGNTLLFSLLCKVRSFLKDRLTDILAEGFGHDADRRSESPAILFSGCYFAATGATEDRQAFVRAIFDKLEEEQEEIEWTGAAVEADRRRRHLARTGFAVSGLLAATLLGMLIWRSL